jgi:serine protease Do
LDRPMGALVARVMPGSPAEQGGVQEEDIIIEFNGQDIERSGELPQFVGRAEVGEKARVKVVRGGREKMLSVEIGELPEQPGEMRPTEQKETNGNKFGLRARELSEKVSSEMGLGGAIEVVAVDGLSREAGLRAGDIILRMKTKPTQTLDVLESIISGASSGDVIPVLILRDGRRIFLTIKVP